jgi:hypothetical protein
VDWKVQHSAGRRPVEPSVESSVESWQHTAADAEQEAIITAGRLHRTGLYVNATLKPDNTVGHDHDAIIVLLASL